MRIFSPLNHKYVTVKDLADELNRWIRDGYGDRELLFPNGVAERIEFKTESEGPEYLIISSEVF